MLKYRGLVALLLGTFLLVNGCGSGGGNNFDNLSSTIAGLWSGTFTYSGNIPEEVVAITIENGRFEILIVESGIQLSGTAVINGADVVGEGFAHPPVGGFLPGAVKISAFSFTGTLDAGVSLTGEFEIEAGNDTGSFALEYDPEHTQDASLSLVADMWTRYDAFSNPLIVFDINSNGDIFGQSALCTSTGEITVPDPDFNTYEWHVVTAGDACPSQDEEFFGLGTLSADNASLLILGSGPRHPLLLPLER